jgi:polyhydroxyalkanoate synthesis regulator phasin
VRDALVTVGNAVSFANSLPFVQERAPGLKKLDNTFARFGEMSADAQQLRSTLRAAATGRADQLTQETATALTTLTSRIDARLEEIQTGLEQIQAEIQAFQARLEALKSRLLLIYNLAALLVTLLCIWVIYSQFVVIRHHARLFRTPAAVQALPETVEPASLPAASEVAVIEPAETPPDALSGQG